jgi:uncharacterized protein YjbJ (UPF0337 family)
MGNTAKRGKGAAKELGGKAERKVGKLVGNERMQARGRARELEGQVEQERAKVRERVTGKIEETLGKAKAVKGIVRQKLNRADDEETDA